MKIFWTEFEIAVNHDQQVNAILFLSLLQTIALLQIKDS